MTLNRRLRGSPRLSRCLVDQGLVDQAVMFAGPAVMQVILMRVNGADHAVSIGRQCKRAKEYGRRGCLLGTEREISLWTQTVNQQSHKHRRVVGDPSQNMGNDKMAVLPLLGKSWPRELSHDVTTRAHRSRLP